MAIEQKIIDELKAKHGELVILSTASYEVVVKAPNRQVWRKFVSKVADEKSRADAVEVLFLDCVVYPDAPVINAMLDAKPALAQQFGSEVADLARDGEVEKKVP
jgi:hypothetical protein